MMLLFALACDYGYFTSMRDPEPLGELVSWQGYVYRDPDAADEGVLTDGELVLTPADGAEPVAFSQLYSDYPGYWGGEIAPAIDVEIRISGPGLRPAVWSATTPGGDGLWFSGALYGMDEAWIAALFEALGLQDRGEVAVWGAPADPDAWDCALVRVQDTPVSCFLIDEAGSVSVVESGPMTWFFATGLDAGEVVVDAGGARGGVSHSYMAEPGDIVLAHWFWGFP